MMLHQYKDAPADARNAAALDSSFIRRYIQIAKCNLALGDLSASDSEASTVREIKS
jgi:hypothetical protein